MGWRILKRAKIKNEVFRLNVSADNINNNNNNNNFIDNLIQKIKTRLIY